MSEATEVDVGQASWRRFLGFWMAGVVVILCGVAALNVVVDPFFVFGTPLVSGFNNYKPFTQGREVIAKAALLPRVLPRTLLVGASKVQVGLDPESSVWGEADRPVFNAGIPGGAASSTLRVLDDAVRVAPVRRVLVMLEFTNLLDPVDMDKGDAPFRATGWSRVQELFNAALSVDALQSSVLTLLSQRTDIPSGLRPNGQMYDGSFRGATEAEGPGALFGQKMVLNAETFGRIGGAVASHPDAPIMQIDSVRRLIDICRDRGIDLDVVLPPVHADVLRLLDLAGVWPRYLDMRKALADVVATEGRGRVRLWSFMGFDEHTAEPVPPLGVRTPALRWFWEPNHFRSELGSIILETVYHGGQGFGVLLTPADVVGQNEQQTAAMERDKAMQPAEWLRAERELARYRGKPKG